MEWWPKGHWAEVIRPLLTGEAQGTYYTLSDDDTTNYTILKEEILSQCDLSPQQVAKQFHC